MSVLRNGFLCDLAIDKGQRADTTEIVEDALKEVGRVLESLKKRGWGFTLEG